MGTRGPKPGDPGYRSPRPFLDRLWAQTTIEANGCWIWHGTQNGPYGRLWVGSRVEGTRRQVYIHRAAYEELVGPVPSSLDVDHICVAPLCWNPEHLQVVTGLKNRKLVGERHTTCRRGHPRTEANTYRQPNGERRCRLCRRLNRIARRERERPKP